MGLISTIFTVLTVIFGGACIMLFVSTKTLRDSRDDQEKRIAFLEAERVRDKAALAEKDTAIHFWRSAAVGDEKLDALSELVVALSTLLNEHHGEARQNWVAVKAGLGHMGSAMDQGNETAEHMSASIDLLIAYLKDASHE